MFYARAPSRGMGGWRGPPPTTYKSITDASNADAVSLSKQVSSLRVLPGRLAREPCPHGKWPGFPLLRSRSKGKNLRKLPDRRPPRFHRTTNFLLFTASFLPLSDPRQHGQEQPGWCCLLQAGTVHRSGPSRVTDNRLSRSLRGYRKGTGAAVYSDPLV